MLKCRGAVFIRKPWNSSGSRNFKVNHCQATGRTKSIGATGGAKGGCHVFGMGAIQQRETSRLEKVAGGGQIGCLRSMASNSVFKSSNWQLAKSLLAASAQLTKDTFELQPASVCNCSVNRTCAVKLQQKVDEQRARQHCH